MNATRLMIQRGITLAVTLICLTACDSTVATDSADPDSPQAQTVEPRPQSGSAQPSASLESPEGRAVAPPPTPTASTPVRFLFGEDAGVVRDDARSGQVVANAIEVSAETDAVLGAELMPAAEGARMVLNLVDPTEQE